MAVFIIKTYNQSIQWTHYTHANFYVKSCYSLSYYTKLQSEVYRDGKEEATQSYSTIRRGADDEANKGRRLNAIWYQMSARLSAIAIPARVGRKNPFSNSTSLFFINASMIFLFSTNKSTPYFVL